MRGKAQRDSAILVLLVPPSEIVFAMYRTHVALNDQRNFSRGMGVLDGVHVPQGKERLGFFAPIGLNDVFLTEMYLIHA